MLDDLVKALKNKEISGAGLDVFEFEPLVHKKLLKMKLNIQLENLTQYIK